jgi:hypothetical protein
MSTQESLEQEIRAMATNCSVCERDVHDAEQRLGFAIDFADIAHPEDAFDVDLIPHQRERHRERLLKTIDLLASLRQGCD